MIARPLLERMASLRSPVELTVLRPPTLEALRKTLAAAATNGEPFQIVHFDGHGAMIPRQGGGAQGVVFQNENGSEDHVSAAMLASMLRENNVPVVVLNACQAGAVGVVP